MAIIHFANSPKKQSKGGMAAVMRYSAREEKTRFGGQRLVGGYNCQPQSAYADFMNTKLLHHKDGGVLYFHLVQSFPKGEEVDPQVAHNAAMKLAEYFDDREVLVCTHTDRDHIHSHLIINSVSFNTGKKLHISHPELAELRQKNDAICQQFGLPVFQMQPRKKKVKAMSGREYHAAAKGESWKMRLMNVVDECMKYAADREQFIQLMEVEGYQVKWTETRKNITYATPDGNKCRDDKLHDEKYLKETMEHEFQLRAKIIHRRIEEIEPAYGDEITATDNTLPADAGGSGKNDEHDIGYSQPATGHIDHPATTPQAGESLPDAAAFRTDIGDAEGDFVGEQTGWEPEREAYFAAAYQVQASEDQPRLAAADPDQRGIVGDAIQFRHSLELAANADQVADFPAAVMDIDDEGEQYQEQIMSW